MTLDKITILLLREGTGDSRMSTEVSCKKKKLISRPTLRLPVEAEDVNGKKGEKRKKINSVTQKISQLPDSSLVIWAFFPLRAVGSTAIVDQ